MKSLSPKQELFVREYVSGKSATAAARSAGYSKKRPDVAASKLLARPLVGAAISEAQARLAAKSEVTAERLIRKLAAIAFGDIRQIFDEKGRPRPVRELPADVAAQIATLEIFDGDENDGYSIRFANKLHALKSLARLLGLFEPEHESIQQRQSVPS